MTRTRVFLVDDHGVVRQGLRLLIDAQPDMIVIGESDRGRGVAAEVARLGTDVVVIDVSMPDVSGPRIAEDLRGSLYPVKLLALTRHSEHAYVQQMLQAGVNGYVLKQGAAETVIEAIRTVAKGGTYLDAQVAGKVVQSFASRRSPAAGAARSLTQREQQVVTMVARGHSNKEVAGTLGIAVKTVESHKTNIMQKLGLTSRSELVRFAMIQGWLEDTNGE